MKKPKAKFYLLDKISISPRSYKILSAFLKENPEIHRLLSKANTEEEVIQSMNDWIQPKISSNTAVQAYLNDNESQKQLYKLKWKDYGLIRFWDYLQHSGKIFKDPAMNGEYVITHPFKQLWIAVKEGILMKRFTTIVVKKKRIGLKSST